MGRTVPVGGGLTVASRFVPVKSFEEAERLFEAGLLLVDNCDESEPHFYRKDFVNLSDPDNEYIAEVWRERFVKVWPMYDFGVLVEDDTSE